MYKPNRNGVGPSGSRGRGLSYSSSNRGRSNSRGSRKQSIDPRRFIKAAQPITAVDYVADNMFNDFDIHELLKTNIAARGYKAPSHIQDKSIPVGLQGKDVIGIANTGTGKTAAFSIPLLNKMLSSPKSRALIIAPTRELAMQIESEIRLFAKGSGLMGALLIGGMPIQRQFRELREKPNIVIGTPGRIKDHVKRGELALHTFDIIVLDEVDRMVDMGFIDDIRYLLNELPKERQSLFFSATLDANLRSLIESFMRDPVMISVKTGDTSDNVEQNVVYFQGTGQKIDMLHDILIKPDVSKVLIFSETKRNVERLSTNLVERGFKADALHGDKSQSQRLRALKSFRDNNVNILVATDVAARGIDVSDITHVINFDIPNTYDDYTHRVGRAGRGSNTGFALTFVEQSAVSNYGRY